MATNVPVTTWRPTDGDAEIINVGSIGVETLSGVIITTLSGVPLVTLQSSYIDKPVTIWEDIAPPTGALQQESLDYILTESGDFLEAEFSTSFSDDGSLPDTEWIVSSRSYEMVSIGLLPITTLSRVAITALSGTGLTTLASRSDQLADTVWAEDDSL